jgi:MFS family permease
MQFVFIPIWGRLSDRVGRRPVLLWSIGASAVGMAFLGVASTLPLLFAARLFSGMATANIAVAQAYIADITPPERRARAMGAVIGSAFGLGFIMGPAVGGALAHIPVMGRTGTLPAFVAAALSTVNLLMALYTLPESLPPELRGKSVRRAIPLDLKAARAAAHTPGIGAAVAVNFLMILWFAGMEQTFRLFTADKFGLGDAGTGRIFTLVGLMGAIVQGALVRRLARRFGEPPLIRSGLFIQAVAFTLLAMSPSFGSMSIVVLYVSAGLIAAGSGITTPTLSAYASQRARADAQGLTLGTLQSASALARVLGPALGGVLYNWVTPSAPYYVGAVGFLAAMALAIARVK